MSKYQDIIDRLEKAKGADSVLGRDVFFTLDNDDWKKAYMRAQEPCGCPHHLAVIGAADFLPDVTASIDAAIALVDRTLPGWIVETLGQDASQDGRPWGCELAFYCGSDPSRNRSSFSFYNYPSAQIAILLAMFNALHSQEGRA